MSDTGKDFSPCHGARLLFADYSDVLAAFDDFGARYHPATGHLVRGGNVVDEQVTVPKPGWSREFWETQRVESSFTDTQRAYLGASMAALRMLITGRIVTPAGEERVPPLSAHIVERALAVPDKGFKQPVGEAMVDAFVRAGRQYPGLTPAMTALVEVGGADGTQIAYEEAGRMLLFALQGDTDPAGMALAREDKNRPNRFSRPHLFDDIEYVVRCPGRAPAREFVRQAGAAALELAAMPEYVAGYNSELDHWRYIHNIENEVTAALREAASAAAILCTPKK